MGDNQSRPIFGQCCQGILNASLGLDVDAGGSFVQDDDRGGLENCPSQGQPLFFTHAQAYAFFSNQRIPSVWQFAYEIPGMGDLESVLQVRFKGRRFGKQ